MIQVETVSGLRSLLDELRRSAASPAGHAGAAWRPTDSAGRSGGAGGRGGRRVALVPTMGYLHEGHLSLVDRAREVAEVVVMSIFVNPLQFGAGEDLERYPRDLARDADMAAGRGVDVLFVPGVGELYPQGDPAVRVVPQRMAERLCGRFRPGHFEGVLTVVAKLFNTVLPDAAVFGRKDLQQAVLIRRMVADLNFPIQVEVAPIVRESDGLAMSSRNAYLSPAERLSALTLFQGLTAALRMFRAGERRAAELCGIVQRGLASDPGVRPQYIELVDTASLEPLAEAEPGATLAVAAHVGATRLIDNILLD